MANTSLTKFTNMRYLVLLAALAFVPAQAQSTYPDLPNPTLTPGDVQSIDTQLVCMKDYPAANRNVTTSKKNKIYKAYGVDKSLCVGGCKIDHLIPIAIGGSNDVKNLWPHEYGATHNVFAKTRLEIRLRKEVCSGKIPITEAQACIRDDWTKCFDRFYKE